MPLRTVKKAFLVAACSALTLAASAQSRLPPGVDGKPPAATAATRSVAHYLDLERALAAALREHRRDAASQMLAPEFEARTAGSLDAVGATAWLDAQLHLRPTPTVVRDLAVHELGEVDVVSFFFDRGAVHGAAAATLYVVDVWRRADGRLTARYEVQPTHPVAAPTRPRGRA